MKKRPLAKGSKTITRSTAANGSKRVKRSKALGKSKGANLPAYAELVWERLLEHYPHAHCALDFTNAFELLCATILSA
ncbi:MAG TPA: hypothetical protein VGG78_05575, partial [Gemmatimonadaceae bacterium]